MDSISKEERSWVMAQVRSKHTKPERIVRSFLHRMGFRFSLHSDKLIGKPDIVLPKYKTVIFVHGCFWHRHKGCINTRTPKTNVKFWKKKFDSNVKRFNKVRRQLKNEGWTVIVIWECQARNIDKLAKVMKRVELQLKEKEKTNVKK